MIIRNSQCILRLNVCLLFCFTSFRCTTFSPMTTLPSMISAPTHLLPLTAVVESPTSPSPTSSTSPSMPIWLLGLPVGSDLHLRSLWIRQLHFDRYHVRGVGGDGAFAVLRLGRRRLQSPDHRQRRLFHDRLHNGTFVRRKRRWRGRGQKLHGQLDVTTMTTMEYTPKRTLRKWPRLYGSDDNDRYYHDQDFARTQCFVFCEVEGRANFFIYRSQIFNWPVLGMISNKPKNPSFRFIYNLSSVKRTPVSQICLAFIRLCSSLVASTASTGSTLQLIQLVYNSKKIPLHCQNLWWEASMALIWCRHAQDVMI